MRNYFKNVLILYSALLFVTCNSNSTEQKQNFKGIELPNEYLGNYHGIQPSYFIKNEFGDDAEINGKKISIPLIDFKLLIKENGVANMQQINLEDNSRY